MKTLVVLLGLALASDASAQIRASERGRIAQTIDGTLIEVDYARPRLRGRLHEFGELVHFGEAWTPGANESTTLRLSRDVKINNQPIAAGKYSVWFLTRERGNWTLLLDADTTRYHGNRPKPDSVRFRFDVETNTAAPVEVLTWSFPDISENATTLELRWAEVRIPLHIEVTPLHPRAIARAEALRFVGEFDVEYLFDPKNIMHGTATITYSEADSTLRVVQTMGTDSVHMLLQRVADGVFAPIMLENGQPYETMEFMMEFDVADGRATGFLMRGTMDDEVAGRARRRPRG